MITSFLTVSLLVGSCESKKQSATPKLKKTPVPAEFEPYWGTQEAEVTSFELLQARFGSLHKGEALMIFETEQFSRTRQVKMYQDNGKKGDVIQVLRMNQSRLFNTGVSSSSAMTEVHTPVNRRDGLYALKVSCSVEEWLGQSYSQLNLEANKYNVELRSYLETERDQNRVALMTIPEDQLWCSIRINPKDLPTGEMMLIPGLLSCRFQNKEITAMKANLTLTNAVPAEMNDQANMMKYVVNYVDDGRLLEIFFNAASPYEIYGWK